MGKSRFTILRPLTNIEAFNLTVDILDFFAPLKSNEYHDLLGIPISKGAIQPLNVGNFLKKMKISGKYPEDSFQYLYHIEKLILKLVQEGFLKVAGSTNSGYPSLNIYYYATYELTKAQAKKPFWLGKVLGPSYLAELYSAYVVRIEGIGKSDGIPGTGSGILISPSVILTCAHNIEDMVNLICFIENVEYKVDKSVCHTTQDVGLIYLLSAMGTTMYPYLGQPYLVQKTITLGYPPFHGMREAALIVQTGEINAISNNWGGFQCITLSSITRPGNSGGPVVSLDGYIVGLVTQASNSTQSFAKGTENITEEDQGFPFYNALSATALSEIIREIDLSINIDFENYE